jgi:hypothetical protein
LLESEVLGLCEHLIKQFGDILGAGRVCKKEGPFSMEIFFLQEKMTECEFSISSSSSYLFISNLKQKNNITNFLQIRLHTFWHIDVNDGPNIRFINSHCEY